MAVPKEHLIPTLLGKNRYIFSLSFLRSRRATQSKQESIQLSIKINLAKPTQCLDVVLGSMAFRLNELHKEKPAGSRTRGKRTIAKERLYKYILERIQKMYPYFNIGITTGFGSQGSAENLWLHSYRHWNFIPNNWKEPE